MGSSASTFGNSAGADYTGTAAEIAFDMKPGVQYRLYVSSDAWFAFIAAGGAATVAKAANAHPVAAKTSVLVSAAGAAVRVSVVQDSGAGHATLSEILKVVSS